MFFGNEKILGLDIGSQTIKMVELNVASKGISLENFAMLPTPTDCISNGQITDPTALSVCIKNLIKELKAKSKNLITGMSGSSVIIKKITIPRVDAKVLKETIRFESEQYIPFDINSVALTYVPLQTNDSPEAMDVLIVAAQNEFLIQYVEAVSLSGLTCSVMDVNNFALANCFELNYGVFPGETIGIMNFGHETTNFVVISNGEVIFCRDLGVGGVNFSNEIARSLGVTQAEAESFKLSAVSGMDVPDEVHSIMSLETERFVEEIKNSYDFFLASNPQSTINRYYFSGGTGQNLQLIEKVAQIMQLPFEKMDPFKKIKVDTKKFNLNYLSQISSYAPIAIGLAARGKAKK